MIIGFIAAALVVLLIPGPGVIYVMACSVEQGHRAGFASALGLSAGAMVHVAAATAGLSAIVIASASAFSVVKILGACYLVYLGVTTLFSGRPPESAKSATKKPLTRLFTDGVIVSVLNPKIAIFFLAFLPQFVDLDSGPVPRQVLLLGLIYAALALITDSSYALLASTIRRWLDGRILQGALPRYVSGSLYLGLGVATAFTDRRD